MKEKTRITRTLKQKGFDIEEIDDNVLVASLNRKVYYPEVMEALEYSVDEMQLVNRYDGSVAVIVLDDTQ